MNKVKITSIMPTFNVEKYISDAIESLVEQIDSNIELEVFIVDDGSTDMTKSIIKDYQEKYPFIILIEESNIGPGEARNIAMKKATGDYITFIDGDDIIYPKSYEKLLNSARINDADIVVGNVSRFDSTRKFFLSGLHKKIFSDEKVGTHILEYPNLLFDTTSWNKLFKTSFLHQNKITFPEGILYEDIPFNMEAHLKSSNTNIINDYVYRWQLRNDGDKSITQSRHNEKNMLDRITAMAMFNDIIKEMAVDNKEFIEKKELKELEIDLKLFLDQLSETDESYFDLFSKSVTNYIENMKTDVFQERLATINKIKYRLVMENRKEDLVLFSTHSKEFWQLKNILVDGRLVKKIDNSIFETFLDSSYFDMTSDVSPVTKIKKVSWEENILEIDGVAFLKYLDTNSSVKYKAYLNSDKGSKKVSLPVELYKDQSNTQIYGGGKQENLVKRTYDYDYSGYKIKMDLSNIEIQELLKYECSVSLSIENGDFTQELFIGQPAKGYGTRPKDIKINNVVYRILYNKQWQLKINATPVGGVINNVILEKDQVKLLGCFVDERINIIRLTNYHLNHYIEKEVVVNPQDKSFELCFDISDMEKISSRENFYPQFFENDNEFKVEVSEDFKTEFHKYGNKEICSNKTRNNFLQIYILDEITAKLIEINGHQDGNKVFNLTFDIIQDLDDLNVEELSKFSLQGVRNKDGLVFNVNPVKIDITEEVAKLSYQIKVSENDLHMFGNSSWKFSQVIKTNDGVTKRVVVMKYLGQKIRWSILKNNFIIEKNVRHEIQLMSSLEKEYFDKGPRRKKMLKDKIYPFFMKLPQKKKMIMFEAYWGRSYSCNPKAMYEYVDQNYPGYTCVWSLNNPYEEVKGNAIKVKKNSWRYYYYLARSKYFINNVNWPNEYIKRDTSVEIQTLHGTFLKTMGLDVEDEVKTKEQLEGFRKRHGRWDYLVSPSSFMTKTARRVFEFNKEMLEFGFPRNDLLVNAEEHQDISIKLKEKLNIPADKKVILYAPTYRNKSGFNFELDIKEMREKLSDDYVLLVRLHYFVAKSLDLDEVEDFVVNVCNYPDVQELLLITDVLITDYSSIMFDYANLNRPMLFFTYDLEYYRDVLRGMYLDFEEEAPGKLCKKTEELIESLEDLENYQKEYSLKLNEFRSRYNEFEKGEASKQAFEKIFRKK
ncbi:bifunctional glycosyltransferase/CDP-glycerol:glycerophosphate glycerophosphotransferase [Vagococcus hydrophili]|uniref:Glycosyltransferase n=1 Tax=Vagococcus hydrophili TaxID=2714947 RepID=A0A6G8AR38_9ENTE|nr:bifunctional glycosyltransferase/CDP-glycerol:glycerophosphate glycerophosphotransferase [Vagococcus hydrophili]QIL47393.1 glycosyltransferase [Vagococcus hydrophili]